MSDIRSDQVTYGRRIEGSTAPRSYTGGPAGSTAPKKFVAKGHDAQLQDAQFNKRTVTVTLMSGDVLKGTISRRDKFTITVTPTEGGDDLIVYKHGIETIGVSRDTAGVQ